MNPKGHNARRRAFALLELAVVVLTISLLATLVLPALAKTKTKTQTTVELNNVAQILRAVQLYAGANNDYCPHPGWGTAINCWVHSANIRSALVPRNASSTQLAVAISNQLTYFRKSQLAPYLNYDQTLFDCPTDVAMRRSGNYKLWYMDRQIKLTSYNFTGAVSGFGAPKQAPNANTGGTYKLSSFQPSAFLTWELDETRSFNFNDAAINQEDRFEGTSLRHTIAPALNSGIPSAIPDKGLAMLGRFGGDAGFIPVKTFTTLRNAPAENDLRCGPGYR